jgi:hypothetical protein
MRLRKLGVGAVAVASAIVLTAATVYATSSSDTEDHFSVKSGTVISGSLKSGTGMTFVGSIDGIGLTVTCTGFTGSGAVPAKGLSVTLSKAPAFSGCTDTLGGTDTITTNTTNGKWKLSEVDAANDEAATEPNTGDKIRLTIPKAGASFSSSFDPGCVITVAPSAAASVTGSYNDKGTGSVKNASITVSGSGCVATAAKVTATIVLSTPVHDVS